MNLIGECLSFGVEERALDDGVNERAKAVILVSRGFDDALDLGAIREGDGCAGGVGEEFGGDGAGDLIWIGEEQRFEIADVFEDAAVGQLVGGIDGKAFGVFDRHFHASAADDFEVGLLGHDDSVAVAPEADDIEIFESESRWIDLRVTGGATR